MSSELELRKWLNRPTNSFTTNLQFGIKVWHSIEFVLITKYEIITEEFCLQLPGAIAQTADDDEKSRARETADVWESINEFLALKYSAGAISSAVKGQLLTVLQEEAAKTRTCPNSRLFDGLLLALNNTGIQNYFKSNVSAYGGFLGSILNYLNELIKLRANNEWIESQSERIVELVKGMKVLIKQTPNLNQFNVAFTKHCLVPYTELIILLKKYKTSIVMADLLAILQDLYLDTEQNSALRKFLFDHSVKGENPFTKVFNIPTHSFFVMLEAILVTYRHDSNVISGVFKYFQRKFTNLNERFAESGNDLVDSVTYLLYLLKQKEVQLNFTIGTDKAINCIGTYVLDLFNSSLEMHFVESVQLIRAALNLNPMMLEQHIFTIMAKVLLTQTKPNNNCSFDRLLCEIIDIYRRLSRAEKFTTHLLAAISNVLETVKLSSKKLLKRKSMTLSSDAESPLGKRIKLENGSDDTVEASVNYDDQTFFMILKKQFQLEDSLDDASVSTVDSTEIAFAWPSRVGCAYSKFISGLVSKPSIVVWRTLIFAITDQLRAINEQTPNVQLTQNQLFLIDLTCELLCQYFQGSRLAEHADKIWTNIEEMRQQTIGLLKEFGNTILNQEHNVRTMNAFLKVCLNASNFDLLCWYYCPDTLSADKHDTIRSAADHIHSYLQPKEWILIEQRITNFGKLECRTNLNRLYLQKLKASVLFKQPANKINVSDHLLSASLTEYDQIAQILNDDTLNEWFINLLTRDEKILLAELIVQNEQTPRPLPTTNIEFVEILLISIFKSFQHDFQSKKSIFILIQQLGWFSMSTVDQLDEIVCTIRTHVRNEVQLTKFNLKNLEAKIKWLEMFSIGELVAPPSTQVKNSLFFLTLALYVNLRSTKNVELERRCFQLIREFLHFGEPPAVFTYLKVTDLPTIFPNDADATQIYELIFEKMLKDLGANKDNVAAANIKMLSSLLKALASDLDGTNSLKISMILVEYLAKDKKCREHFQEFREAILMKIKLFFGAERKNATDEEKQFVCETLSGFTTILLTTLSKRVSGAAGDESQHDQIDNNLKNIFKTYLKYSVNSRNPHSIKLLNAAVTHKQVLEISEEDVKEIMQKYWADYVESLRTTTANDAQHQQQLNSISVSFLKILINNKTDEEFIDLLDSVKNDCNQKDCLQSFNEHQSKIFNAIGKCQLNKIKGSIFNEFFKQITYGVTIQLRLDNNVEQNLQTILNLLECQRIISSNSQIPISIDLIDDILSYLPELNIKKWKISATNLNDFNLLHSQMSDLCYALIQHRHFFIVDRVPQFVAVFKDLCQAVCWYRSDRLSNVQLDSAEISMLAELAHKMENIIKAFVKYSKDVKRIAPYLLIFIINLMISNEKTTTLFPKIKTHIEAICYDLISVCDHRVEGFIMRNCNEASKQIYEQFVKEYNKYHKFKGKV